MFISKVALKEEHSFYHPAKQHTPYTTDKK
jgi:hypothetical protein